MQNTLESYEFSLKILNDMKTAASDPVRRAISYAASLALKQNAPQVALEILSSSRNANYVTVRNLKVSRRELRLCSWIFICTI